MSVKYESRWLGLYWWLSQIRWPLIYTCCIMCVCGLVIFISITSRLTSRLLTHSVHRDTNIASQSQPTHFVYCGQARLERHFWGTGNCHLCRKIDDWLALDINTSLWTLATPAECTSDWDAISQHGDRFWHLSQIIHQNCFWIILRWEVGHAAGESAAHPVKIH